VEACSGSLVRGRGGFFLALPFEPVVAKGFNRMRRALGAVATAHVVCGTVVRTTPADAFRMFWVNRNFFGHRLIAAYWVGEIVTPSLFVEALQELWFLLGNFIGACLGAICAVPDFLETVHDLTAKA